MMLTLFLLLSCNGTEGNSAKTAPEFTLDERLFSGTGRWQTYDAVNNIDYDFLFRRETPADNIERERLHWLSGYRGGSQLINASYDLTALSERDIFGDEYDGVIRTGDIQGTYSFIDDDTLEVCIDTDCLTLDRVP